MFRTAERISNDNNYDNPIFQRQLFAYEHVKQYIKGDVLEIGCGEGYGAKLLADLAEKYTAIDKFKTQDADNLKNVTFVQANVPPITAFEDNSFDTIISFQLIEHIKKDRLLLEEVQRILKPNGKFIFTTPNRKMSLTRNPYHIREYVESDFKPLMSMFSSYELNGVFGSEKMMQYHRANKASVEKITRFDIFNFQYILPRFMIRVPYNIGNMMSRKMIAEKETDATASISTADFHVKPCSNGDEYFDFFCIAQK